MDFSISTKDYRIKYDDRLAKEFTVILDSKKWQLSTIEKIDNDKWIAVIERKL